MPVYSRTLVALGQVDHISSGCGLRPPGPTSTSTATCPTSTSFTLAQVNVSRHNAISRGRGFGSLVSQPANAFECHQPSHAEWLRQTCRALPEDLTLGGRSPNTLAGRSPNTLAGRSPNTLAGRSPNSGTRHFTAAIRRGQRHPFPMWRAPHRSRPAGPVSDFTGAGSAPQPCLTRGLTTRPTATLAPDRSAERQHQRR